MVIRGLNAETVGDNIEVIKSLGKKLIKTAEKVGLTINDDKTEYLVVSRSNRNYRLEQHFELEGHKFKKVSQFKYLGSIITQDNELKTEVLSRIQLANNETNEWRKLHNDELKRQFQRPDIVKEITKRRLSWGGVHAWRKQGSLVRQVIENEPIGKRPLGRPRLRREDCVKKDLKMVDPGIRWREAAEDRDRWQDLYLAVWS
ncbi:ribosome biogenesis protein TSR3 isoform X1 [Aphis craccivora]|uniref:Ribosome biogenesis protein TSR3 isoform X1 n=1 Tax=Aphis craccivora TaxID=307492 RepID=A0A6G0ZHJ2_APHCR|nr:ribosome biogenesis protein TSR3 isoform X1 [Aphis craccivora]